MQWETVIGLEVHVELLTDSKMFCSCAAHFAAEPNTSVCPVCLGLPGALPVCNEKAVELAVICGLALNCRIAPYSRFNRKNYTYPDLPKAYQISQYELPLAEGGWLELDTGEQTKKIGITRAHLEEDAGKLVHREGENFSLVDLNRAGVPLLEIVSEPDLRSPLEARLYLEELKTIIQYAGVSDCKMEEGSLRCDANISLRPAGSNELGVKIELKNMNSFKAVERALAYEEERQRRLLDSGKAVRQQTRRWDEQRQVTLAMRSKEDAQDYRYFPDPDLPPLQLEAQWVEQLRRRLPVLPAARRRRYVRELGLPVYDARVITSQQSLALFFDAAVQLYSDAKKISNWVMGEYLARLNEAGLSPGEDRMTPGHLVEILELLDSGAISNNLAKQVFAQSFASGQSPATIVREQGLQQISDTGELLELVKRVIEENSGPVNDYRSGKKQALGYLVGQVMKLTGGKANPRAVNELLKQKLG